MHSAASAFQHIDRLTVGFGGFGTSHKQANPTISSEDVLGNSKVLWIVRPIIAMEGLSSCTRSNAEHDGIVDLGNADALFVVVTDLYEGPNQLVCSSHPFMFC